MKNDTLIREFKASDITAAKQIIAETEMFPPEYLDDMLTGYLSGETEELWYSSHAQNGELTSFAYCAPERMTEGTWNLLLIAVAPNVQGQGIGAQMMAHIEQVLSQSGARVLLVETSGLPEFQLTRQFYPKCGYTQVATIPEFYDKGDDKIVFWKKLGD